VRAIVWAAVAGATLLAIWVSGMLTGWFGLAVAVLLALLVPLSRQLSRRILLAGMLTFGWVAFLYWWDFPVGSLGRAGLVLPTVAALIAGWVVLGSDPRARARRLVPEFRLIDLWPVLATVAGVAMYWGILRSANPTRLLAAAMGGFDNVGHFDMFEMIRTHGVTIDALSAAPDGSSWYYASYPQAFHSAVALVSEVLVSPAKVTPQEELVGYVHATMFVYIAISTMVVAGLCALPALRSRPAVAAPMAAFVGAAFLVGPGANAMSFGFVNFVVCVGLTACMALLVVTQERIVSLLPLAAICGSLIAIANGWIPLLALALPAVVVLVFPWRRARWRASPGAWTACVGLGIASAYGAFRAYSVLAATDPANKFVLPGGIYPQPVAEVAGVTAGAVLACAAVLFVRDRRTALQGSNQRTEMLIIVPLIGSAVAAGLAAFQLHKANELSYYFYKFVMALELVSIVVFMIALASLLTRKKGKPDRARARVGIVVSVLFTLIATFAFGYPGPRGSSVTDNWFSFSQVIRKQFGDAGEAKYQAATDIFSAVSLQLRYPDNTVVYFRTSTERPQPLLADSWVRALTGTWSTISENSEAAMLASKYEDGQDRPRAVAAVELLKSNPKIILAVPADQVAGLRAQMPNPELAGRIVAL